MIGRGRLRLHLLSAAEQRSRARRGNHCERVGGRVVESRFHSRTQYDQRYYWQGGLKETIAEER